MFVIWGSRKTVKQFAASKESCDVCKSELVCYVKVTTWFTLFFIPIFPVYIKYVRVCPVCSAEEKLPKTEFFAAVSRLDNQLPLAQ